MRSVDVGHRGFAFAQNNNTFSPSGLLGRTTGAATLAFALGGTYPASRALAVQRLLHCSAAVDDGSAYASYVSSYAMMMPFSISTRTL